MIFAIVRAIVTTARVKRQIDPIWMYLWTSIELNIGRGTVETQEIIELTMSIAIIVACIAPYRSLFTRGRDNSHEIHRPQSLKGRAHKLWTSSFSRPHRQTAEEEDRCTMDLPYLAPWVETEHQEPATNTKQHDYGTILSSTQREDPSMTVNMPYLAPWSVNDSAAVPRESYDILFSPPPLAHILERGPGEHGVLPSARTSIEEDTTKSM